MHPARKSFAGALLLIVLAASFAAGGTIQDKFAIGGSVGLFLPQDNQGGGFRFSTTGIGGEREVELDRDVRWTVCVQYGLLERLTLELEMSRFETRIGSETVLWDPDSSTVTRFPVGSGGRVIFDEPRANGDEEIFTLEVGDLTMSPVSVNALWHWGMERKTSVYAGGGPTYVFMEYETDPQFREFVGYGDGSIDDSLALNIKGGIQVELTKRWFFDFYASYLLVDEQFSWKGISHNFGEQAIDLNQDGILDLFGYPADYRLSDPGKFRVDGLTVAAGMRIALPFGLKANKKKKEIEAE